MTQRTAYRSRHIIGWLLTVLFTLLLSCGGGSVDDTLNDTNGLPGGAGNTLAIAALDTTDNNPGILNTHWVVDTDGQLVALSELGIWLSDTATMDEVNALLDSFGGYIANSITGSAFILVHFPAPADLVGLETLIRRIESSSAVASVRKSHYSAPTALPRNISDSDSNYIDHMLAVRATGAWNAREALQSNLSEPPVVVVNDFFGVPELFNNDFSARILNPGDLGQGTVPDIHGYHVLGTIAADYGGASTGRGKATGMYPSDLDVLIVENKPDNTHTISLETDEERILIAVAATGNNIVVNSSVGFSCTTQDEVRDNCSEAAAREGALHWIRLVRSQGMEDRFLHIVSAGNTEVSGDTEARYASPYTAAALMQDLRDSSGVAVAPLKNTLVVENTVNSDVPPFRPVCLEVSSKVGGDIAAIGTEVWSLTGPQAGANNMTGTSMATPQVSGLAAYVWALSPNMSVNEVRTLLERTSRTVTTGGLMPVNCLPNTQPPPVIDAYAAVLATDSSSALDGTGDPQDARIRGTLLDIADNDGASGTNGQFDENDLALWLQWLQVVNVAFDYSRFDLNGDGYTGGDATAPFDLDINSLYQQQLEHRVEGTQVVYNENQATDFHILCYYAYSPLYTGDIDQRSDLMTPYLDDCSPRQGNISFVIEHLSLETYEVDASYGADCNYSLGACIETSASTPITLHDGESTTLNSAGVLLTARLNGGRLTLEINGLPSNSLDNGAPMATANLSGHFVLETDDGQNFTRATGYSVYEFDSTLGNGMSQYKDTAYTDTSSNTLETTGGITTVGNGTGYTELIKAPVALGVQLDDSTQNQDALTPGSYAATARLIVAGQPMEGETIVVGLSGGQQSLTTDAAGEVHFTVNTADYPDIFTIPVSHLHTDNIWYKNRLNVYVDTDNDGFGRGDNCPTVYNPSQSDPDGNGRGDACDLSGTGCGRGYKDILITHTVKEYHSRDADNNPVTSTQDITVTRTTTYNPDGTITRDIDVSGTKYGQTYHKQYTNLAENNWTWKRLITSNHEVGLVAQWGYNTASQRRLVGNAIYDGIGFGSQQPSEGHSPVSCADAAGASYTRHWSMPRTDYWSAWWGLDGNGHYSPDPAYATERDYNLSAPNGPCLPNEDCPATFSYTTEKHSTRVYN